MESKILLIYQPVIQEMVQASLLVKGRAFGFYKFMRQSLKGLKRAWEEDLEEVIDNEMWKEARYQCSSYVPNYFCAAYHGLLQ